MKVLKWMRSGRYLLRHKSENQTAQIKIKALLGKALLAIGTTLKKIVTIVVSFVLFCIVITCTVISKVSFISLASCLIIRSNNTTIHENGTGRGYDEVVGGQLLVIVLVPQFVTLFCTLKSLFYGVCEKKCIVSSCPTIWKGVIISVFEVAAMSCMVLYVLPRLPSIVAILVLSGVFPAQALVDICYLPHILNCFKDDANHGLLQQQSRFATWMKKAKNVLENKCSRIFALILQAASVLVMAVFAFLYDHDNIELAIAIGLSLFVLSIVWSSKVQQEWKFWTCCKCCKKYVECVERGTNRNQAEITRSEANFISSIIRIVLYCLAFYALVQPSDRIQFISGTFVWKDDTSYYLFPIQIISSCIGYMFMWLSCTMVFHRGGLALPMFLCNPLSVVACIIIQTVGKPIHVTVIDPTDVHVLIMMVVGILLWVGQIMTMEIFICEKKNAILANDSDMFLSPRYDAVFLEQHTLLNRQVKKGKKSQGKATDDTPKRTTFICTTMYQEDREEMKQLLSSICKLARYDKKKKGENSGYRDNFESHIFLDGGVDETQLNHYALQLFSLFEETLNIKLDENVPERFNTPYGCQLKCDIEGTMPIYVHIKDNLKVKNKKRWSQVMYMNYVLNFRLNPESGEHDTDENNTFILTTDADIEFTPESSILLLDRLESNPQVGGVCARTHPNGSGLLYWYQVFEYAIGHWFQKAAEDIMGTVLCCPGCFSVFRCSALKQVLEEYSSDVTTAKEFLFKDMGEDRWLCSLLVEKGWALNYCAISKNHTHCPETMDEFFKQRKRWIPSTIANLYLLITKSSKLIKGNNRISIIFVLFQAILLFSTVISPATVTLVIAAGFDAFGGNPISVIVPIFIFCLIYGFVCLYCKPKFQKGITIVCTVLFSVVMFVVLVGYVINIVQDIKSFTIILSNYNDSDRSTLPTFLAPSNIYLVIFALIFFIAAILHPHERKYLLCSICYLIALPSTYLLLLIYSAAKLDDTSWGTREDSTVQEGMYKSIKMFVQKVWRRLTLCVRKRINENLNSTGNRNDENSCNGNNNGDNNNESNNRSTPVPVTQLTDYVDPNDFKLADDVKEWLDEAQCRDFEAINIPQMGHRLRLERKAKRLPSLSIDTSIPNDISDWLEKLELRGYQRLFAACGYSFKEDLESVKKLTENDLIKMGINKRAHLQRIHAGQEKLTYPTTVEFLIRVTKSRIDHMTWCEMTESEQEFWNKQLCSERSKLKPQKAVFMSDNDLRKKLKVLRNFVMCGMLFINAVLITVLLTLKIKINDTYKIPEQILTLLFIAIYAFIMLVQFSAMIIHRCISLIHHVARSGTVVSVSSDDVV